MGNQKVGIEMFLEQGKLNRGLQQADKNIKRWAGRVSNSMNKITQVGQSLFFITQGLGGAFRMLKGAIMAPTEEASALAEVVNKFNVVMGQNKTEVAAWAEEYGNAETGIGRSTGNN